MVNTAAIETALERARADLAELDLADAFEPRAAAAIVASGLHRLVVPATAGGLGGRLTDAAEVLLALGAIDGSTALGFAMQVHVTGALVDSPGIPAGLREGVFAEIVERGALLNNAATEEGGGSPSRGAVPGTTATPEADGSWRISRREDVDDLAPEPHPCLRLGARGGVRTGRGRRLAGRPGRHRHRPA